MDNYLTEPTKTFCIINLYEKGTDCVVRIQLNIQNKAQYNSLVTNLFYKLNETKKTVYDIHFKLHSMSSHLFLKNIFETLSFEPCAS